MIALAVCLALALTAFVGAPRLLVGPWQVHRPRLALLLWHAALAAGAIAVAAATAIAIWHALAAGPGLFHETTTTTAAWISLLLLGAAVAAVSAGADALTEATRRNEAAVYALPHTVRPHDAGTLLVCDTDEPFALALGGPDRTIAVTRGLLDLLTPAQTQAVIAHEAAHLRGRHLLALRTADLVAACAPAAASRRFRRRTGLLLELIADDRSSRAHGAAHLVSALRALGDAGHDPAMQLRADRLEHRRAARPRRTVRRGRSAAPGPAPVSAGAGSLDR